MNDNSIAGRHVLVVEDEVMIVFLIEDALVALGATIAAAATIEGALGLIRARTFDAATLDLNLGGVESYPVADALIARGVPFVFVTGYGKRGLRENYRDRPVLDKPFRTPEMVDAVTRLLPR